MKLFALRLSVLAGAGALALALTPPVMAGASAAAPRQAAAAAGAAAQPVGTAARVWPAKPTGPRTAHTDLDGSCESFYPEQTGDFCFYHAFSSSSSLVDFWAAPCDLGRFVFVSPGDGQGLPVIGNWAFAVNMDPKMAVALYSGPNCTAEVARAEPGVTVYPPPGVTVIGIAFVPSSWV